MTNREDPFGINQKRTGVFVLFWKKRDRKGENVMLSESIKKLVQYGVETGITPECERIYATNLLLDAFGESEYTEPETEYAKINLEATLDELLDEAVKRAKEEITSRRPELDEATIDEIAEEIGIGAIRYYIARLSPEKHITFKWDEALSFERGCASIQYAHARACKLLKKAQEENGIDLASIQAEENWSLDDNEKELVKLIAKFPSLIEDSASIKRVHPIAQYCQDLAGAFNRFYKAEQVIGSRQEDRKSVV